MNIKELEQKISALKYKNQQQDLQYLRREIRQILGERGIPQGQYKNDVIQHCLGALTSGDGDIVFPENLDVFVDERIKSTTSASPAAPASSSADQTSFYTENIRVGMSPEETSQAWKAISEALRTKP